MPAIIKSVSFDSRRFDAVRKALGEISAPDFFSTIPLKDILDEGLSFAKDVSPSPSGSLGLGKKTGRESFTAAQMLRQYASGWNLRRAYVNNRLSFVLGNVMEGRTQQAKWFQLFEKGSRASVWIAKRTFSFFSEMYGWTTIRKGRSVRHAATAGFDVLAKTSEFIELVLLPRIQSRIEQTVARRLAV